MTDVNAGASAAHRHVSFGHSIVLFFKNYLNFQGRSSRGAYWWLVLASLIAGFILGIIEALMFGVEPDAAAPFSTLLTLATLIPSIALGVRRLHDIGRSGWWTLIFLTIIGIVLLIYWAAQPGERATNAYGPDVEANGGRGSADQQL